jgi:hypothetical protein
VWECISYLFKGKLFGQYLLDASALGIVPGKQKNLGASHFCDWRERIKNCNPAPKRDRLPYSVINSSFCSSHKQKPSSLQGLLFSCLVDWGVNLAVNADLNAKFKIQNSESTFCILHFAFCISPVLPYFRPNLLAETLQQVY